MWHLRQQKPEILSFLSKKKRTHDCSSFFSDFSKRFIVIVGSVSYAEFLNITTCNITKGKMMVFLLFDYQKKNSLWLQLVIYIIILNIFIYLKISSSPNLKSINIFSQDIFQNYFIDYFNNFVLNLSITSYG